MHLSSPLGYLLKACSPRIRGLIGPVSKGMAVYAWKDGVAGTIQANALVGVALETSTSEEEKLKKEEDLRKQKPHSWDSDYFVG